jgi:hypothetical protein
MNKNKVATIHTIFIILAWTSPFYLDWKLIFLGIIVISLQYLLFNGCMLTNLQFSKRINKKVDDTMYSFYLEKLRFKPNKKVVKFLARYIFPIIILLVALIWQILLNHSVFIKI